MKLLAPILAVLLGLLGLVFLLGSQGQWHRLVVGGVLLVAAAALVALPRLRPQQTVVVQRLEPGQALIPRALSCTSCGAALPGSAVEVAQGLILVRCPHCEASYQLEADLKW